MSQLKFIMVIFFAFLMGVSQLIGQQPPKPKEAVFWFSKWKTSGKYNLNNITILMDSSAEEINTIRNSEFAQAMVIALNNIGLNASYCIKGNDCDISGLAIKFTRLKSQQTLLSYLGPMPMCAIFEIRQINNFPQNENRMINTTLSLSYKHPEAAMFYGSEKISKRILKSIK